MKFLFFQCIIVKSGTVPKTVKRSILPLFENGTFFKMQERQRVLICFLGKVLGL